MASRQPLVEAAEPARKALAHTLHELGVAVASGHYPPGSNLPPEPALCAAFGVSRTVVREAIKSLVAKRLLSTGPKVGTRVLPIAQWNGFDGDVLAWQAHRGFSREHLRDLQALRRLIEPEAARLASAAASADDLAELEAAWQGMRSAYEQGGDSFGHERRFHQMLLRASGNRLLAQMEPALAVVLQLAFELSLARPESAQQALQTRRLLLDGLLAGSSQRTERACSKLIAAAQVDIVSLLNSRRKLPLLKAVATPLKAPRRT